MFVEKNQTYKLFKFKINLDNQTIRWIILYYELVYCSIFDKRKLGVWEIIKCFGG